MKKKSFFYRLGLWFGRTQIKLCEKIGHKWASYGTLKSCDRCYLTEKPKKGFYFNCACEEVPHVEREF